ncbi:carbamoyltransferase [Pedococcus dokdonensis]|uniref:Carbamoyltransferase n=1 Tax=Pedococcus dokdonensis TaxID=443156 RepID=A0A1H0TX24_9MICO|nr:carbamoyltransferase C-terminal domain-containing protein [Pedococcus dokdonensis]SDP58617.1 carbamoyltransferase [Pedococcus dokdonensis]
MTLVLGVNGLTGLHDRHDPGAALVDDDGVVAAVEEERLNRVKRAPGYAPEGSVREVLAVGGVELDAVDVVAYPWSPTAIGETEADVATLIRDWCRQLGRTRPLEVRFVEHHAAHAWCGFAFAPQAARAGSMGFLVLDGSGETTSGAAFILGDAGLSRLWNLRQSASLGGYYEALTLHVGFDLGEEGKTMGLASYGAPAATLDLPPLPDLRFDGGLPTRSADPALSPSSFRELRARLLQDFRDRCPHVGTFQARADLALGAERLVGERVLAYARELLPLVDTLVHSGGVALNCTVNAELARLCREAGVRLVIPPCASDTGVALGAAVAVAVERGHPPAPTGPFLGRSHDGDSVAEAAAAAGLDVEACTVDDLAAAISERSALCGWFEGRSEVGPRALGRRSVLARPDDPAVRDRLNRVKGREAWRPLAPSLTAAEFDRSFPGESPSPHMLIAALATPEARERLAGVVHVDGSARAQVVDDASPYLQLIRALGARSGSEAVTCTSFNRAGEPMVYTPADALRSATRMGLDLLAGPGWGIRLRRPGS